MRNTSVYYEPHIDSLRGLAVLVILLFHLDASWLHGGFIGVDIFFVISGYLITQIIVRDLQAHKFSFLKFYSHRIRRIFPALFVMLLFSSLAAIVFLGPQEYSAFFKALRFTGAQASNLLFSRELDYFAPRNDNSPLLHTWSLGVEAQFYLFWPFLLFTCFKARGIKGILPVLCLAFLVSLAISEYWSHVSMMQAFYLLPSRAWQLALGGILGLNFLPPVRKPLQASILSLAGVLMILACAFLYTPAHVPGLKALLPCLGAALCIYALPQNTNSTVYKILSSKFIIFTGLISYSLYLWHWPLITIYKSYFDINLNIYVQVCIFILSFVLAYLSWLLIEQPCRKIKIPPLKIILVGLGAVVILVIASNLVKNQNNAAWRMDYKFDAVETSPDPYFKLCAVDGGYNKPECTIGPHKDHYEVILAGDSYAAHYSSAVLAWAKMHGLTVRLFLRGACNSWVESEGVRIKAGKIDKGCMEMPITFYRLLEQDHDIQYVFLSLKSPEMRDDIARALKKITVAHKKTIYLGTPPVFATDPINCQLQSHLLISRFFPKKQKDCLAFDPVYIKKTLAPVVSFKERIKDIGIPYFDPLPIMQTPFDAQGHFLFVDDGHLNKYGSLYLAPYLADFTDKTYKPPR